MRLRSLWLGLLLTACTPSAASVPPEPTDVIPQHVIEISRAAQIEPPALAVDGEELVAFTLGSDAAGIHHDVRVWSQTTGLSLPTILPLPPQHPFHQRAYPGLNATHLLWIDSDPAAPEFNRVYGALISGDQVVLRGPTAISAAGHHVVSFSALPQPDGGLIAAYQGGGRGESDLYLVDVDATGVPRPAQYAASNLDGFAMTSGAEDDWLIWYATATGQIMRAPIVADTLASPIITAPMIYLGPGDRMIGMNASIWGDQAGAIINVARMDGTIEAWRVQGDLDAPFWDAPGLITTTAGEPVTQAVFVPHTADFVGSAAGQITLWQHADASAQAVRTGIPAHMVRPPTVLATSSGHAFIAWSDVSSLTISQRFTQFSASDSR